MNPADFTDEKNGQLIKTSKDYWAFLPTPLPPKLTLSWDLVNQLSDADRALSELAGTARTLPNPHLLIGPFIRREAVLSSRIEGTQASLSDLLFFEASGSVDPNVPDAREVGNYVKAMEYGRARLKKFPLSLRFIRELHERLMEGARGDHLTPGEFRRSQNWIGPAGCTLMDSLYVPPPVEEMEQALAQFETYLHAPSTLPLLVRLAAIHYQFEAIHPFLDGNGRIGRLLITLLLCKEGILSEPLLYLSAYFERQRDEYYQLLLAVSQRGRWAEWMSFFLRGVAEQSRDALVRSGSLRQLWQGYRGEFQSARSSALQLRLIDQLFAYPAITASQAARLLQVTHRSAQLNIEKLIRKGILKEATGKQRNRIFIAPQIIKVIESPHASKRM
ncbi:MAG: Fic family protein [Nitrospiraceae bacterium]